MPRAKNERVNLEQALRVAVEETIEKHLNRLFKGKPFAEELKQVRSAVTRIERRLEGLDSKIGSGRTRRAGARTGSPGRPPLHEGCKVAGCDAEHYALGLCSKHYQQERRSKEPEAVPVRRRGKGAAKAGRPRKRALRKRG